MIEPFGKIPGHSLLPLLAESKSNDPVQRIFQKFEEYMYSYLSYEIRDFIYNFQEKMRKSTNVSNQKAYKAFLEMKTKARGLITSDVLSGIPSTRLLENYYRFNSVQVSSLDEVLGELIEIPKTNFEFGT